MKSPFASGFAASTAACDLLLMVAVIVLGVYPTPLLEAADTAGKFIF